MNRDDILKQLLGKPSPGKAVVISNPIAPQASVVSFPQAQTASTKQRAAPVGVQDGGAPLSIEKKTPIPSETIKKTPIHKESINSESLDVRKPPDKADEPERNAEIDLLAPIPLGFQGGEYFYMGRDEGQVRNLSSNGHTSGALLSLARLSYWQTRFQGPKGVDWNAATDFMMASCRKVGIFNHDKLRGRGVSFDNGRAVLHLGTRLIVDGIPHNSLILANSELIYERGGHIPITLGEPLSDEETYRLVDLCNTFSWATPDMGMLFAGWIALAPVCGGLPWRTHVWLGGQMGSGKSFLMTNVVKPMLGKLGFPAQSKTTEAGIRQHLKVDARPVIFDEAETQNDNDRMRLQHVLDLARQASSEDGFDIIKGTASGKEIRYRVRSSFLFSSINFGATQAADESRIIPISLVPIGNKPESAERFDLIKKMVSETVSEEYAGRLLSRTLNLLPIIRANIKTFTRALSDTMTARQADTIACLVAGYYSLCSDKKISLDEARVFVKDRTWITMTATRTETEADHEKAISHLLQQILRDSPSREYSIAEAAKIAYQEGEMHEINRLLGRHGLKVRDGNLLVGRSHYIIDKFFENTPWSKVWDRTFLQYPGTSAGEKTTDFAGYKKKAIFVPLRGLLA